MSDSEVIKKLREQIAKLEEDNQQLKKQIVRDQKFFNLIVENTPYPVFFKDKEGVYRFCNNAFADFSGWKKDYFIGHTIFQSIQDKELAEIYHKADMELIREKGRQMYVSQVLDSEGTRHDVIFNKVAILDDNNEVKGLLGFIIDITGHKELERELKKKSEKYEILSEQYKAQIEKLNQKDELLRENESLFRQLAENTNDVFILRENGVLKYVSPHIEDLTGRSIQEMMANPHSFHQWIHPEDKERVSIAMHKILSSGEMRFENECRIILPDNSVKWIWIRAFEIPGKDGSKDRDLLVFTDITKSKALEQELANYKINLEALVKDRTEELEALNEELSESNEKISKTNAALSHLNEKLNHEIDLRKQAQIQVQESEEKLRNFVDQSLDGIVIIDEDGRFIEWNRAVEQILGYRKDEVLGMHFWDLEFKMINDPNISLDDIEKIRENGLKNYRSLDSPVLTERRIQGKNSTVYLSISTFPIRSASKKLVGRIIRDVTQKKISEEELNQYRMHLEKLVEERARNLKESEERFRQIVETSPMGMHFYKLEGDDHLVLTGANKAAEQILGVDHSLKIGKIIEDAFPPLANTDVPSIYKRLARQFDVWREEQRNYKDDQINGAFEIIAFHTGPNQMAVMFNDITDRIRAQETIKQNEEKFRNIFYNSVDMILIVDKQMNIVDANAAVFQKLGFSREEIVHLKYGRLEPSRFFDVMQDHFLKLFSKREVPDIDIEIITKNKKTIPIEASAKLIEYENQEAILMIMRDITERKDMERKVINAIIETEEKERSRLASDLHDEIGPLLSSIKMYLSTLNIEADKEKVNHVLSKLNELVRKAVTATREISNDISPHLLTNHGLHAAVNTAIHNVTEFINISFDSNIDEKRFPANVEIVYYRVINELINNTIKHAKASDINIHLTNENDMLVLRYNDNGVGYKKQSGKNEVNPKGMGIYNLLNRVKSINGKYKIETDNGKGFFFELNTSIENS